MSSNLASIREALSNDNAHASDICPILFDRMASYEWWGCSGEGEGPGEYGPGEDTDTISSQSSLAASLTSSHTAWQAAGRDATKGAPPPSPTLRLGASHHSLPVKGFPNFYSENGLNVPHTYTHFLPSPIRYSKDEAGVKLCVLVLIMHSLISLWCHFFPPTLHLVKYRVWDHIWSERRCLKRTLRPLLESVGLWDSCRTRNGDDDILMKFKENTIRMAL